MVCTCMCIHSSNSNILACHGETYGFIKQKTEKQNKPSVYIQNFAASEVEYPPTAFHPKTWMDLKLKTCSKQMGENQQKGKGGQVLKRLGA